MVTDALDTPADRHLDRIVGEVIEERDWNTAALRLECAVLYAEVVGRWAA